MEKFIKIFDNIYPNTFLDKVENILLKSENLFPYNYLQNVTSEFTGKPNPGFVHWFLRDSKQIESNFLPIPLKILYDFSFSQNIFIEQIFNIRSFLETPSTNPGPDLPPHIDYPQKHFTLLYYVNDSEGDTILFKDDYKTEIKRVSPKKGRVIFFDGSIPHCGTRNSNVARSVINFNFIGSKL